MCPSLIQIGLKTAEKALHKQTDKQTNRHYENNGHLAVNQQHKLCIQTGITIEVFDASATFTSLIRSTPILQIQTNYSAFTKVH